MNAAMTHLAQPACLVACALLSWFGCSLWHRRRVRATRAKLEALIARHRSTLQLLDAARKQHGKLQTVVAEYCRQPAIDETARRTLRAAAAERSQALDYKSRAEKELTELRRVVAAYRDRLLSMQRGSRASTPGVKALDPERFSCQPSRSAWADTRPHVAARG